MSETEDLAAAVLAALERDTVVAPHSKNIEIHVKENEVTLEGEVGDIAAKRLARARAGDAAGVRKVIDRLKVSPSEPRGDGDILDGVFKELTEESAFRGYNIAGGGGSAGQRVVVDERAKGIVEILVNDGVVTLVGNVQSLSHRRLAEVLAWWAPGTVNVVDRLSVVPPEEDTDDEITDALRIVLEKDPWLDASQISVHTRGGEVTLEGLLHSEEQKHMAQCNAWYVPGVRGVVNRIEVRG